MKQELIVIGVSLIIGTIASFWIIEFLNSTNGQNMCENFNISDPCNILNGYPIWAISVSLVIIVLGSIDRYKNNKRYIY